MLLYSCYTEQGFCHLMTFLMTRIGEQSYQKQIWENAMSELPLASTVSINTDKYISVRLYHTKAL